MKFKSLPVIKNQSHPFIKRPFTAPVEKAGGNGVHFSRFKYHPGIITNVMRIACPCLYHINSVCAGIFKRFTHLHAFGTDFATIVIE